MDNTIERASGDLRRIQLLALEMLSDFDRVCRAHGIDYYLYAGSLLGAERHGGFIPWDSDIDVAMMRYDYERFLKEARDEIDKRFFVQCDYTDPYNRTCFTRIRANDTLKIEKKNKINEKSHYGFYIDVFPLDFIAKKPNRIDKFIATLLKVLMRVKAFRSGQVFSTTTGRTIIAFIVSGLTFFIPRKTLSDLIYRFMTRHNKKKCTHVTSYASKYDILKEYMPTEVYGKPSEIMFEGKRFLCPNRHKDYLQRIYGNYTELPPEKDRVWHSENFVYDLGPYKEIATDSK